MPSPPGSEYRVRPDLTGVEYAAGRRRRTVLKDPATSRYFTLSPEEAYLLSQFDGASSYADVAHRFARRFAPSRITLDQLKAFADGAFRDGLLTTDRGVGGVLWERTRRERRTVRRAAWLNPLYLRLAAFDPQPGLDRFVRGLGPLFTPAARQVAGALVAAAIAVAVLSLPEIWRDAARITGRAGLVDALALAIAYAAVKSLHELGHAVVCRRVGAECREVGLVLLCFSPCLYCDVSDAWMTPGRGRRIAIAAAGVLVEGLIAAACLLIWRFTHAGAIHDLSLAVAGVASINTVLLNGNPLMRYDGYYILSDAVGVPNLAAESSRIWRSAWSRLAFGVDPFAGYAPPLGRPGLLALYGAASFAYRVFVLATLGWIALQWTAGTSWETAARLAIASFVAAIVGAVVYREAKVIANPVFRRRMNLARATATGVLLAAVGAAALAPAPRRVDGAARLAPRGERLVVAAVEGRLVSLVATGTQLAAGDVVATLAAPAVLQELARSQGDVQQRQAAVERLELERFSDETAGADLAVARETLAAARNRLERKRAAVERLTVRAPLAGVVLPAYREDDAASGDLPRWSGSLHEPANAGAVVAPGDPLCRLGDPSGAEVEVLVSETEIEYLAPGQAAWCTFPSIPGSVLSASVAAVSRSAAAPAETSPDAAAPAGRPSQFPVRLTVTEPLPPGAAWNDAGRARIAVSPESAWSRFLRFARRTVKM